LFLALYYSYNHRSVVWLFNYPKASFFSGNDFFYILNSSEDYSKQLDFVLRTVVDIFRVSVHI
jgi:hypothetical protein